MMLIQEGFELSLDFDDDRVVVGVDVRDGGSLLCHVLRLGMVLRGNRDRDRDRDETEIETETASRVITRKKITSS